MTGSFDVTRRQVLQAVGLTAAGVAGAGALGACSPGKTDEPKSSGTASGSTGTTKKGGEFHGAWPYSAPPQGNMNLFSTSTIADGLAGPYGNLMHMPSALYLWSEKTYFNLLVDEYKLDEAANTYTLKIKSGITWSDGKPITSKDYETTLYIAWLMSDPIWRYVTAVEAKDDQTVVLKLQQPSTVLERYILKQPIADSQTYGTFADRAATLQKAGKKTDDAEAAALLGELQKLQPEQVVSGPFMIDKASITNTQITLVKNAKSAFADKVNFDKIVLYNGETPVVTPLVQTKVVDYATHGFPPASEKAFQAAGIRIIRPPNLSGPALLFNLVKQPEFKDKRVRQAFAHIIDRNKNGEVSLAESGKGVKYMAGFSDNSLDEWLPSGIKDKLKTYDQDNAKAEELLKQAGWTKSGNQWKTQAGKDAKYEISFPNPFADWSASAKNAAAQLTAFGIPVTPAGVDDKQAPIDIDKGNFQLGIQAWGASSAPHPWFSFRQDLLTHNIPIAKNNGGKGMGYEMGAVPGVDGKPVDLEALITACGAGLDLEKQKESIGQMAQIFNEELPMVPLFERYGNNACLEGKRVKEFPKDDDPILKNPVYADNFVIIWLLQGKLQPA